MSELQNDAPMSFLQRLTGIFVSPAKVFESLRPRPIWILPFLILLLYIPILQLISFSSETGKEAIRQEMMKSPRSAQMTPEQQERALGFSKVIVPVSTLIAFPVITFALVGIIYFIFSILLGGESTYKQALSAWTHCGLIGLVGGAIQTGMVFLKGNLTPTTSIAAFLPFLDEKTFLYKLFQTFDLFVLWQLAVLSIGMGIMSRVGTKKAAVAIFSAFVTLAVLIAGIRQAFA
jgi:hypothetical protein